MNLLEVQTQDLDTLRALMSWDDARLSYYTLKNETTMYCIQLVRAYTEVTLWDILTEGNLIFTDVTTLSFTDVTTVR